MIVIRVELWSAITHRRSEIARVGIWNVGCNDTGTFGDYECASYTGRDAAAFDQAMTKQRLTHSGKVKHHARKQEHVLNLVAKALTAMGYGVKKEKAVA